jgi:RHS repeat-associated protein
LAKRFYLTIIFIISKIAMNLLTDVLLRQGLAQATATLRQFARQANFIEQLRMAFGENFDGSIGLEIGSQFQVGDFRLLPDIQILSREELGTANGAYAGDLDKIFVAADFLAQHQGDVNAVSELLLEEIGHKLDRLLNGSVDSPGDEGAIFRLLATGQTLSADTLSGLKRQDDHAVITIDGQTVAIEKQDFTGTTGDDTLVGTAGDDTFTPLTGHDNVDGGTGNDTLIVDYSANDNSNPQISYALGIITSQTNGAGTLYAYKNNTYDQVNFSGIENFNITGTKYNDNLIGGSTGSNILIGGAGDDNLVGGTGNDTLRGGDGNDTLTSNGGIDILDGGAGIDFAGGVNDANSTGDENVDVNRNINNLTNGIQLIGIDGFSLTTGLGNDTIVAGNLNDTIVTGAGNDSISVGLGQDNVDGGTGNDTLIVDYSANDNSNPQISYALGIITSQTNGAGTLYAYKNNTYDQVNFSGIENFNITGTKYNDNLIGGTGNDTLIGGAGSDTLTGGTGNDVLNGTSTTSVNPGSGEKDSLTGGAGADLIILGDSTRIYYDQNGNNDYALITDFNPLEDKVQLNGSAGNYLLTVDGNNTNLHLNNFGNSPNELVGIFQNVTGLSLTAGAFTYGGTVILNPANSIITSISNSTASEGLTEIFTVNLSTSPNPAQVQLTWGDITAKSGINYSQNLEVSLDGGQTFSTVTGNSVTVPGGTTSFLVRGRTINDLQYTGNQTYTLIASTNGTSKTGIGTIVEINPIPQAISISGLPNGSSGSNQGQTTIVVTGKNFSPTDQISLVAADGTTKAASKVYWVNNKEAWATFDLQGLTTGSYDLSIKNGGRTAVGSNAFTVTNGSVGSIQVNSPTYPFAGVATVSYSNSGQTDVAAPLFKINATNAQITYPSGTLTNPSLAQLLNLNFGNSSTGPEGILAPGASGNFSFSYTPNGNGLINFTVQQVNPTDVINWAAIKTQLYTNPSYSSINSQAWDAIWTNFTQSVGNTYGSLQTALDLDANYLSQVGGNVDISQLLQYELVKASNSVGNITIASANDAFVAAPGLALTFNRTFSNSLVDKDRVGALGVGWSHEWDINLSADPSGNVTIYENGGRRVFTKLSNGTYQSQVDDYGQLTLTSGKYALQEKNGNIYSFRSDNQKLDYVSDPNGNRITAGYTGARLTSLAQTNGESLALSYNSQGTLSKIVSSTSETTTYTYDPSGQHLLSVTNAQGTTSYTYDSSSNPVVQNSLLSIANPDGTHQYFSYNSQGQLAQQSSDGGIGQISYTYGQGGGVQATDALGNSTSILTDASGRVSQYRDPLGNALQADYSSNGNLTSLTTPDGATTAYRYDSQGNIIGVTDALDGRLALTYTPIFNKLQNLTDQRGNTTKYGYDTAGNLTGIIYADGTIESFSYNSQGKVLQSTDRKGSKIDYTYDTQGRLLTATSADGSAPSYTYDSSGNVKTATNASGTISLDYDAANRLTKITYPNGKSLTYAYNAGGQRISMVDQSGFTTNYSYTAAGQLARTTDALGNPIATYTYDLAGNLTKEVNGNGTYKTYEYDRAGNLTHLINYAANNTINSRFDYTYNNVGEKIGETTLDGTWTYQYDAIGELTHAVFTSTNANIASQDLTYQYDAAGNRIQTITNGTTINYSTNNVNEYINIGNTTVRYDANGNLISQLKNGITTTYTYNAVNRLTGVSDTSGNTWTYTYDALGNRIASSHNGQQTTYLVDPTGLGRIVGQYDSSGNTIANYTYGLGLTSQVSGGNTNYYNFDSLGSTVGLTGNSGGSYLNSYTYSPFGESLSSTETVANSFQFVGQYGVSNGGNGLYLMGAREYDPITGRFTQQDPIGLNGGDTNLYRYTNNSPTNFIDPSGLFCVANAQNGAAAGQAIGGLIGLGIGLGVGTTGGPGGTIVGGATGGTIGAILGYSLGYLGSGLFPCDPPPQPQPQPPGNLFYPYLPLVFNPNGPFTFSSYSAGDVHLKTLDGIAYDFQGAGEYTLVKSTTDDFEIQTRQEPWGGSNSVTINTAAVIQIGGQKIGFYLDDPNSVRINGVAVNIPDGALYSVGQTLIARSGVAYNIFSANGDTIELTLTNCISLSISLADNRKGNVVGLLGDYNNTLNNEFALRDGTVIGSYLSQQELYGVYGNSWRIAQSTSLFDYAAGQTTDTFTNLNFPLGAVGLGNITPQALAAATQIAQAAGITDPTLLQNAIYDLAISNNDTAFLQGYTVQQQTINRNNPNVVTSVSGYGSQRWVAGNAPLPYTVNFSNNATQGTNPVAQVTISEQLDPNLDLSTFQLTNFGFAGNTYVVPAGLQNYARQIDLAATKGILVNVAASLDLTTSKLTWTFTSIDPATGNAITDLTKGFLPPNGLSGAGSGYIGYTVQPKADITNATVINAQATISFDRQTPIQTAAVFNTIDRNPPTSAINPLPVVEGNPNFTVAWQGSTTDSGLAYYNVYVSVDNGQYTLWQNATAATSATYNGRAGSTYAFYSVATDNVGLIETNPASARVTTVVVTPSITLALDSGSSSSDGITNIGIVTVTGLQTGAASQYSLDAGNTWTTFAGTSFTLTDDDAKSVTVRQTDSAGNVSSSSAALNFTLDTAAPVVPLLALANGTGNNSGVVNVSGLEPSASGQYSLDAGNTWTAFTGNSFTLTGNGTKAVTVRQTDLAGNVSSSSAALNVPVGTVIIAPTLTLASDTGSSFSDGITNSGVVNVTGLVTGATLQYSLDDGTNWTAFAGTSFTLTGDGAKAVTVRQTDLAGNVSSGSTPLNFTLDTTAIAPTLTLAVDAGASSTDAITSSGKVNVAGLAPGATSQYSLNGGTTWTAFTGTSFTLTGDGKKSVTVRQTDLSGNVSSRSTPLTFTLDTVAFLAPTLKLAKNTGTSSTDAITNSGKVNVAGLKSGATGQYSLDNGNTWTTITGSSFTLTGDGAKAVTVRQTDLAGNVSASSTLLNFTLDTTVIAPLVALATDTGISSTDGITSSGVVNVTGLETGATSQYSLNGGTSWRKITGSSFTLTGDGAKSVTVRQTDLAGNVSSGSTALNFTLDTKAPTVLTVISIGSDASATNITLNGKAEANSTISLYQNVSGSNQQSIGTTTTNNQGAWSFATSSIAPGNSSIEVKAADVAGNLSPTSALASLIIGTAGNDTLFATVANNNTLIGGAGNDTLFGASGNNTLIGGSGNDVFGFDIRKLIKQAISGVDTITDFTVGQDNIQLSKAVFKTNVTAAAGSSVLTAANFSTVTTDAAAATAGTAIVYNGISGKLFYNPNLMTAGFGGGTSDGYFAQLNAGLNLTHNDFIVTV